MGSCATVFARSRKRGAGSAQFEPRPLDAHRRFGSVRLTRGTGAQHSLAGVGQSVLGQGVRADYARAVRRDKEPTHER